MYLSRVLLDSRRRETAKLMGSAQAMHAAVMTACATASTDTVTRGRVLWRVDPRSRAEHDLYIASPTHPVLEQLAGKTGPVDEFEAQTADYDPFLSRLSVGQRWRFRLTANPVRSEKSSGAEHSRGRVRPHRTPAYQLKWFEERVSRYGVTLVPSGDGSSGVVVRSRSTSRFSRRSVGADGAGRRDRVEITMATYDGLLEVRDVEQLRECLVNGIGRAKAYGCGLMTLAPA